MISVKLVQITAPHFCAGITLVNDTVDEAAPIVKWMRGKNWKYIQSYCINKRWQIAMVGID